MFGVTRRPQRDPWMDLLYNLERRMGRIFTEPLFGWEWPPAEATVAAWVPAVDIFEEPDHIRLVAELPGVKPEDVKMSVDGNLLTIKGTKEQVAEEKAERIHRYERSYGAFERSFTLPVSVDAEKIKASMDNGVLTVLLPKVEKARAKEIKVELGSPEKLLKG